MKKLLLIFTLASTMLTGCANSTDSTSDSNASNEETQMAASTAENANTSTTENATHGKVVLLDFYATWCGPCRAQSPVINNLQKAYPDLEVKRIDVDENEEMAAQYDIRSIPTLVFLVDGKPASRYTGYTEYEKLETTYKELIKQ